MGEQWTRAPEQCSRGLVINKINNVVYIKIKIPPFRTLLSLSEATFSCCNNVICVGDIPKFRFSSRSATVLACVSPDVMIASGISTGFLWRTSASLWIAKMASMYISMYRFPVVISVGNAILMEENLHCYIWAGFFVLV